MLQCVAIGTGRVISNLAIRMNVSAFLTIKAVFGFASYAIVQVLRPSVVNSYRWTEPPNWARASATLWRVSPGQ